MTTPQFPASFIWYWRHRVFAGFFWTCCFCWGLRFQMLFWATWFRGEARPLEGSVKFLLEFFHNLTCDSIKITRGGQKQEAGDDDASNAPQPNHHQFCLLAPFKPGTEAAYEAFFLPPLSRKMSLASHNVNFRDLGCTLNAPSYRRPRSL